MLQKKRGATFVYNNVLFLFVTFFTEPCSSTQAAEQRAQMSLSAPAMQQDGKHNS